MLPMPNNIRLSKSLLKSAGEAIREYHLIRDGERIMVGLSGGKDSLTLLHLLIDLQKRAPVRFELAATTIDPQMPGYDPSPMIDYLGELGIPFFLERYSLTRHAKGSFSGNNLCPFCSRMRRGKLYGVLRRENYQTLALAHHLDDAAETFLINSFFGGKLRTMRAVYQNDDGDIRVIRPLIYCRERQIAAFANNAKLPIVPDNCPSCDAGSNQRKQMKALLTTLESNHKGLFASIKSSLRPLITNDLPKTGFNPLLAEAKTLVFVARESKSATKTTHPSGDALVHEEV